MSHYLRINAYIVSLFILAIALLSCNDSSMIGDINNSYQVNISKTPADAGIIYPTTDTLVGKSKELWLLASSKENFRFSHWSGDVDSTSKNPLEITVNERKNITAVFKKKSYPLTVHTSGEGAVTEKVIKQKTTSYPKGTKVELTAKPNEGWQLREWKGDTSSTKETIKVTVNEPKEITAVFDEGDYTAPLMDLYNVTSITTGPFSQAMEYVDGELLMFKASSSTHDQFDGVIQRIDPTDFSHIGDQKHNLGHANNTSYIDSTDVLMMGSLPGFHGTKGEIYIFYNFSKQLGTGKIDFHSIPKKVIDISGTLPDSQYGKTVAAFGESKNIVYISGGFSKNWAKIKLGMGNNDLPNGTFEPGLSNSKYNGTYKVIWEKNYTIESKNRFGVIQGTDWYRDLLFTADGHDGLFVSLWSNMKSNDPLKRDVIKTQIYDHDNNVAADTLISEGITQINGNFYMGLVIGDERYIGVFEL